MPEPFRNSSVVTISLEKLAEVAELGYGERIIGVSYLPERNMISVVTIGGLTPRVVEGSEAPIIRHIGVSATESYR